MWDSLGVQRKASSESRKEMLSGIENTIAEFTNEYLRHYQEVFKLTAEF